LPKASFIGFTGTPIERGDKNTQAVFGDYIDVYDILQSKEDKATVPIYYEARLAKIDLKPEERPKIDPNFEEVTEDAEESTKESLRRKWAQLEAMVGTDKRIALVAEDLVKHWEARFHRITLEDRNLPAIAEKRVLRPVDEARARRYRRRRRVMKIVMSALLTRGLAEAHSQQSPAEAREGVQIRRSRSDRHCARHVADGFDAPSLHTMYVDKPMRGLQPDAGHCA
jgi:type I restriction enzyme R subunit